MLNQVDSKMAESFPTFRSLASLFAGSWTTSAQRQSLLRLIAVAAEENLSLPPLLEAWAADEGGRQQRRLLSLARLLKNGTSLPDAIETVPGVLRDEDVLGIRFGAQSGALPAALRELIGESPQPQTNRPSRVRETMVYFCSVLVVGSLIVAFIHIKLVPNLHKILNEYDLKPPGVVQWSWWFFGDVLDKYWYLFALAILALIWFTFSARPGRFLRRTFLGRFLYPLRDLRAAEVLKSLGVAAEAGRPTPGALSTLARYHFDPRVRNKLLFVRNEVEQGADVWQSMAGVGLVTPPEARVLETAERVGNRPWALRQLAAGKERRTNRRLDRWSELALPVLVVAMGAFVLFEALTLFVPLVKLIEAQL
jgi:type II secretory pathway component PulF